MTTSKPTIGPALGGAAARGWAHIGVIRALQEAGVRPDLVCGTSVGALVGAAYATGELDRFERWVADLGIAEVVTLLDLSLSGGLLKGQRLVEFLRRTFDDRHIESLPLPFGAVATALTSGAEVASSLNIMQVHITRCRMAGDPADVVIAPRLAHLSLMEFHRGTEAIEEGRRAVASALSVLRDLGLVSSSEQNP